MLRFRQTSKPKHNTGLQRCMHLEMHTCMIACIQPEIQTPQRLQTCIRGCMIPDAENYGDDISKTAHAFQG